MGADYLKNHRQALGGEGTVTIAANNTRYQHPSGNNPRPADLQARMRFSFGCILTNFWCRASGVMGAGETATYTVMVNGIASILQVIVGGAVDPTAGPDVDVVILQPGDEISIRIVTSLNAAVEYHMTNLEIIDF